MKDYLHKYLAERPLFLAVIRAKEASLYDKYQPLAEPTLDVGCGDGYFARVVFSKMEWGVDVAGSRMNEAGEKRVYRQLIKFDGVKIPLPARVVKTAVSNCTLEHVEELEKLLKEIYRVVEPGGKLLTTVMAKPWEENLAGGIIMGNGYKEWMRKKQVHLNLLSYDQWKKAFEKTGWKIKEAVGYLSPAACKWLDVLHYFSLPSLVSYKLTGRWVMWPNMLPVGWLARIARDNVRPEKAGAIFFDLVKRPDSRGG